MIHEIKNQNEEYIIDDYILNEIHYLLDSGVDYTYFDGKKIEIIKDFKNEKERETVVNVEGI